MFETRKNQQELEARSSNKKYNLNIFDDFFDDSAKIMKDCNDLRSNIGIITNNMLISGNDIYKISGSFYSSIKESDIQKLSAGLTMGFLIASTSWPALLLKGLVFSGSSFALANPMIAISTPLVIGAYIKNSESFHETSKSGANLVSHFFNSISSSCKELGSATYQLGKKVSSIFFNGNESQLVDNISQVLSENICLGGDGNSLRESSYELLGVDEDWNLFNSCLAA